MGLGPINIQLNPQPRPQQPARPLPGTGQKEPARESKNAVGGNSLPQQIQQNAPRPEVPDLQRAVEQIQKYIDSSSRELVFSIQEETGRTIITVIDATNGQVIRTIPAKEVLAMAAAIQTTGSSIFNATA